MPLMYIQIFTLCLATIGSLGNMAAAADLDSYRSSVEQALQSMDAEPMDEHWFFTITVVQEEETRVMQSSPLREDVLRRELVSVNGEPPSPEQLQQHLEQEKKRIEDEAADGESKGFTYLVDSSSLALVTSDADQNSDIQLEDHKVVQLDFSPRIKAFAEDRASLAGTLSLNLQEETVEKITVRNTAKLSPAFSVSLMRYEMELVFALQQAQLLLQQMNTSLQGKYGFMKRFDSTVKIQFSDFRRHSSLD